jgi:hypothetical protein
MTDKDAKYNETIAMIIGRIESAIYLVAALFLCALSVSGAIFLILEMDDPLTGLVRISDVPMRRALDLIGRD